MEPGDRVHKVSPGLRALLRRDLRRALARRTRATPTSRASTCGSGRSGSSSRCAGSAPRVIFVNSMSDLFHEDDPARVRRSRCSTVMVERRAAHLPDPDQAPRAPRRARAASCRGRRTSGWACRSRTAAACVAPTTCARCRPPSASSRPSRCSARLSGLDLDGHRLADRRRRVGPRPPPGASASGCASCATAATPRASRSSSSSGAAARRRPAAACSTVASGRKCPLTAVSSERAEAGRRRSAQVGVQRAHAREARDPRPLSRRLVSRSSVAAGHPGSVILDGFAGRAEYTGGESGSPVPDLRGGSEGCRCGRRAADHDPLLGSESFELRVAQGRDRSACPCAGVELRTQEQEFARRRDACRADGSPSIAGRCRPLRLSIRSVSPACRSEMIKAMMAVDHARGAAHVYGARYEPLPHARHHRGGPERVLRRRCLARLRRPDEEARTECLLLRYQEVVRPEIALYATPFRVFEDERQTPLYYLVHLTNHPLGMRRDEGGDGRAIGRYDVLADHREA